MGPLVKRLVAPGVVALCGCMGGARSAAIAPTLPFAVDTTRVVRVRPGITERYIYSRTGPWAIHVLEVDLNRCNRAIAVKGAAGAIGREKTSILLQRLAARGRVVGGVNADFFSLANPPGVPTGTLISERNVITGPSEQPVLGFSKNTPFIGVLTDTGTLKVGRATLPISAWNHRSTDGIALFDRHWGTRTDTASSVVEVVLDKSHRVLQVDTSRAGVMIPDGGIVLIAGRDAPPAMRDILRAAQIHESIATGIKLLPVHPDEVVGGRPLLVRDSTIPGIVDTEGQPGFATGRHPRTAAGISANGKRLILVVVDGRQKPYSDGMTLRELANLMLALGARDAINLDGGGSTTFVLSQREDMPLSIKNHPSDSAGERTVGDALAIVRACR